MRHTAVALCALPILTMSACASSPPTSPRQEALKELVASQDNAPSFSAAASKEQVSLRALKTLRRAQASMIAKKYREASSLYHEALKLYLDLEDLPAQAAIHNDLALMHNQAGEHTRARNTVVKALELAQQGNEPILVDEALYNLGLIEYTRGDDPSAEKNLSLALQSAQTHQNTEIEGLAYNARGNSRRRTNNLAPAIDDYRNAAKIWGKLNRPRFAAIAWMNIGYCRALRTEPSKAALAFQNAIDLLKHKKGVEKDALTPHLEEMIRLVKADPEGAHKKVLKLLGRAPSSTTHP